MKQDKTLVLLFGLALCIALLAGLGLLLVQNPESPLPWQKATLTYTITPIPPTATETVTATSTGTRRPTRTPVLEPTTPAPTTTGLPTPSHTISVTPTIGAITPTSGGAASTSTTTPEAATISPTSTITGIPLTDTPTPTGGPVVVTGIVVNQGTPISNITISLEGPDVLTTTTNAQGAYQFEVDWMDEDYSVVFSLEENNQLNPANDYVLWSWIEGYLEGNVELPEIEISRAPDGTSFSQTSPEDGSSYSAAQITDTAPLTFEWTVYPGAEEYWVDLGLSSSVSSAWASSTVPDTFVDFDGTLLNGTRITPGTYWWAVGSLRTDGDFYILTYSQTWTLIITP